LNKNNKS